MVGGQPLGKLDAIHSRHAHVHQRDLGSQARDLPQGLHAVPDLPDDFHPLVQLQERRQSPAHDFLILDDQHPHGRFTRGPLSHGVSLGARSGLPDGSPDGSSTLTANPPPGAFSAAKTPPSASTLFLSAESPNPPIVASSVAPRPSSATASFTPSFP